jgi:ParB/RepB/Spo0J family partition protein
VTEIERGLIGGVELDLAGGEFRIRGEERLVPIAMLVANRWNPNEQDEEAFRAEIESIMEFGFLDPILVRPHPERRHHFEIIDGEHRQRATLMIAEQIGDDDLRVPVRVIDATDAEARKLTIVMNETRGKPNKIRLARLMAHLADNYGEEYLATGLPYKATERKELIDLSRHGWEDDYGDDDPEPLGDQGEGSKWFRFEVVMTKEDYAAYEEARTRVEQDDPATGDQPIRDGQTIAALVAEYLSSETVIVRRST